MKARVYVTLKPSVLDPQGQAVARSLGRLGFGGVRDVRVGKLIELELGDGASAADLDAMCRQLLANTVIEDYRFELVGETAVAPPAHERPAAAARPAPDARTKAKAKTRAKERAR